MWENKERGKWKANKENILTIKASSNKSRNNSKQIAGLRDKATMWSPKLILLNTGIYRKNETNQLENGRLIIDN